MNEVWSNMYIGPHGKCPLFLSDCNEMWILPTDFRKIIKYQISRKCIQWEPSCSMRTGRRSDTTKLILRFRYFAKAPISQHITKRLDVFCMWNCALLGCVLYVLFIGRENEIAKANVSFVAPVRLSTFVCPSAWNNSPPTEWGCIKCDISWCFETLLRKVKFRYNLARNTGTLNENQFTFLIISRPVLPIVTCFG